MEESATSKTGKIYGEAQEIVPDEERLLRSLVEAMVGEHNVRFVNLVYSEDNFELLVRVDSSVRQKFTPEVCGALEVIVRVVAKSSRSIRVG